MSLTRDESRALAFVALLLLLAAGARVVRRGPVVEWAGEAVVPDSLARVARARLAEEERRSRPLAAGERLDPNTAPEEELDRLPGVGPALARRIVAAREAGGPFTSLEDLRRVRGIGTRALQRLAPHLRLSDAVPRVRAGAGDGATPLVAPVGPVPVVDGAVPLVAPVGPVTAPVPAAPATGSAGTGRAAAPERAPIDLNRATATELEALPGIGPALASRIVAYRDSAGPFRTVDDLVRVRGIGPAMLERLRPIVRVDP